MLSPSLKDLAAHLEAVTGSIPQLRPFEAAPLPLYLRNRYSLRSLELFGRPWILAVEHESWDAGSPGEYEKHAHLLNQHLNSAVAFVLHALPAHARNRMVQKGIPFFVPGSQIYLPATLIDLRERFARPAGKGRATLSPTAQTTLLFHFLREPLTGQPLKNIAEKLSCSAMMLSKVKDELAEHQLCDVERVGRSMIFKFPSSKRDLWSKALPYMRSPVQKTRWVQWKTPGYPALLAGLSALSRSTMLADDRIPTYAFGPKMLELWLERGALTCCPDAEQATAKIEVWSYEPKLLGDNEAVDPLSLYLSLRNSADERIQQQIELLLETVPW